jgi:hypothetical protein
MWRLPDIEDRLCFHSRLPKNAPNATSVRKAHILPLGTSTTSHALAIREAIVKPGIFAALFTYLLFSGHARAEVCSPLPKGDARWQQLDGQYARIEQATVANNAKQLFAVYAPDFEAHQFNGEVWSFKQSASYSTAGFDQVKENISISNTILDLQSCGPATLKATVLQQWSRRQMSLGKLRLYQTTTVQAETWVLMEGEWKRKLVDNERPGAWLIDLKRIDPTKPYDPEALPFDPHGLLRNTDHSN